jgi:DNA-binding PadR family transcriptional regulator
MTTQTAETPARIEIHARMQQIIEHMLQQPRRAYAVGEIAKAIGAGSGTVSPLLSTMVAAGWLAVEDEPRRPGSVGPLRRMHSFTPGTAAMLRRAIQ